MEDDSYKEDLVLLHGDLLPAHIAGLREILQLENIYIISGPKEHFVPEKVQVLIRISEVIDFNTGSSLSTILNQHCKVLATAENYFRRNGRTVDYYGFDMLFGCQMKNFTVLFLTQADFLSEGLNNLQEDIMKLAETATHNGCIKYKILRDGKKDVADCSTFQQLFSIKEFL